MLKGILDIKVYDKDGNLKQHETGENLITDYVLNKMKVWNSTLIRQLGVTTNPILGSSNIINDFSGILLFNNNLIEDKTNYFKQLVSSKNIGHADNSGTDFESSQVGVMNLTASEVTENSITNVWNFGQGKAAGTINSVALCTSNLGRLGIKDSFFYNNNEKYYATEYEVDNNRYATNPPFFYVFKEDNYSTKPGVDFSGNKIYPIYLKNNKVYCYSTSLVNKKRTTKIYEIDMTKYYSKVSFANDFAPRSYSNAPSIFIKDEPIIELTTDGSDDYYRKNYAFSAFNGKIYMVYAPTLEERMLVEFDLENRTYSTIKNTIDYNAHNYEFGYFAVDNNNIYIADNSNEGTIARFTRNFVYVTNIAIDADVLGNAHQLRISNYDDSGLFMIKNNEYNNKRQCITDLYNFGFISKYLTNGETQFVFSPEDFKNMFVFKTDSSMDSFKMYVNHMNISTIKNLTNPVIKGESDEMVVTYRVIKTEA